jgi:hypothetical protein
VTLTRRRVLAAVAAAGGAGALSGSGSAALLGDRAGLSPHLQTGVVDLVVDHRQVSGPGSTGGIDPSDPDGVVDGAVLEVPIDDLSGDEPAGSTLFRIALSQPEDGVNNPANAWVRTDCPAPNTLAELLSLRISYATADGTPTATIAEGSLREVAAALRTGLHLDGDGDPTDGTTACLTDEVFVLVEYDIGGYVGTETAALGLWLAAVQCRNAEPTESPFAPAQIDDECEVGWTCDCCWTIGKVEVETTLEAGETYAFDEGSDDYAIHVTDVDGDTGVAFDLVATDGMAVPPLCAVDVKGGPDSEPYERFEDEFGADTTALDGAVGGIVSAPENPNSGKRYGISYVLVGVCAPAEADGDCPVDLAQPAASVGRPPDSGPPDGRPGRGGRYR